MDPIVEELIKNEAFAWEKIQELRKNFNPDLIREVKVRSRQHALERGVEIIKTIFEVLRLKGISVEETEPGHALGHITRDYAYALILASSLKADRRDIFIGLVGGAVHDIGVALVDRYADGKRAIRHAEIGALLLYEILLDPHFYHKVNRAEMILICYAAAAHTHYLKPTEVTSEDGVTRKIEPYTDTYPDGQPILEIWFTRWIDRLDINGPAFVGRHFLTLGRTHSDFDGKNFYSVTFAEHMRPILRSNEEISAQGGNRTMLEHLNMFASSQNNRSPYGKHDFGAMIELRDTQTERLKRIIESVLDSDMPFSEFQKEIILIDWVTFLCGNIEPTQKAEIMAARLKEEFKKLDEDTQRAWLNGFVTTMKEYIDWSEWLLEKMADFPAEWFYINGKSILETIKSLPCWRSVIERI